jgi:asparagine synthase (glutamine-hydrolysing)
MCGITGILTTGGEAARGEALRAAVERMTTTLTHRGPDDAGTWTAEAGASAVGLGFRRLAIIDLSPLGHQPMSSATGRFTMVFNGEVYNFQSLRRELSLSGARFRGGSDSEVILAAFERWGVEAAVPRFVGMFAIAVWDGERRALHLIRDRLGKKPLFVFRHPRGGLLTFGSELKALRAGPDFDAAIDTAALSAYLRYLYVPAPHCIYRHVRKLRPGHILTVTDPDQPLPESQPYWSVETAAARGLADPFTGSVEDATDQLERLLLEAVELRLQSDVPLGALLSGGIDSSTVVALMRARASGAVKTFTISFDVPEHDEARHAAAVARHLGTDHTELRLNGADALAVVPQLPVMFDEPFADPSQIPTFLVSRLARQEVTVALSGDGGDELFAGYNRYTAGRRLLRLAMQLPGPARRALGAAITHVSPAGWDRAYAAVAGVLPRRLKLRLPGAKAAKFGRFLAADSEALMYRSLVSAWDTPAALVNGATDAPGDLERILGASSPADLLARMMLADQVTYLADDLLAKVDRASMAVSLEARVPLLDHRVVEFSWRLPEAWKIRNGQGKWLLRQVLYRHVPESLVDRPKMGFSVPIEAWLRGPLRVWAEDLLSESSLAGTETLQSGPIRVAWGRFLNGDRRLALGLWGVLMYRSWHERWSI